MNKGYKPIIPDDEMAEKYKIGQHVLCITCGNYNDDPFECKNYSLITEGYGDYVMTHIAINQGMVNDDSHT